MKEILNLLHLDYKYSLRIVVFLSFLMTVAPMTIFQDNLYNFLVEKNIPPCLNLTIHVTLASATYLLVFAILFFSTSRKIGKEYKETLKSISKQSNNFN